MQSMAGQFFTPLINRLRRRGMSANERLAENDDMAILLSDVETSPTNHVNSVESNYPALHNNSPELDQGSDGNIMAAETVHSTSCKRNMFHVLGVTLAIFSSLIFSVSSLLVKVAESIPSLEIVFMRLTLQLVYSLPPMIFLKDQFIYPWKKTRFLVLRGCSGVTAMSLIVYAVKHMPLADARVIFYTFPVYTALLGWIFLKESVSKFDVIATLLSLGGVVLIARPTFLFGSLGKSSTSDIVWLPTILAVFSAIFTALSLILVRKMSQEVGARVVVFYFALIGSIISLLASLISGEFKYPDCGTYDAFYAIFVGTLGYFGQILSSKACELEKANVVSLVRTIGIAFSFILQLIFLNVLPNGLSIGGAILILICNVIIFIKKLKQKKEQNKPATLPASPCPISETM